MKEKERLGGEHLVWKCAGDSVGLAHVAEILASYQLLDIEHMM